MPPGELHVRLSPHFAEDPKVRALVRFGSHARALRDLYVQMTCYCKRNKTDGFVPREEIAFLVFPDPPKIGERDVQRLLEVGLLELVDDGYLVCAYLRWNTSRAQIEESVANRSGKQGTGAWANHVRWHKYEGVKKSSCFYCQSGKDLQADPPEDPSTDPDGVHAESDPDPDPIHRMDPSGSPETETETETETDNPPTPQRGKRPRAAADDDPDFAAFWDAYPRKEAKGRARRAWPKAITIATAKEVIVAAERYRDDPTRSRDPKYVPLPATWLNDERWRDRADVQPPPPDDGLLPAWEA